MKFTHFFLLRVVMMTIFSLFITATITIVFGYFISISAFEKNIQQHDLLLDQDIKQKLGVGWVPKDLEGILINLNAHRETEKFYFIPDSKFGDSQAQLLDKRLQLTLIEIEQQGTPVFLEHLTDLEITGGFPLYLEPHCLKCHPGMQEGDYAGAVLFSSKMDQILLNWQNIAYLFTFFLFVFITTGTLIIVRVMQKEVLAPLKDLSERIYHLRIEDADVQWTRQPKKIEEIDQIDEYLFRNISTLKNIHEKLDALFVTEHESGFFHENRFKEALQYEIYRSDRYERPFSILIVKLIKIIKLDEHRNESTSEKIHQFAKLIRNDIRDADMPFRVGKQLFIVITPETDEHQIPQMAKAFLQKFRPANENTAIGGYLYEVEVGYATYGYDAKNSKDLAKAALERLKTTGSSLGDEEITTIT